MSAFEVSVHDLVNRPGRMKETELDIELPSDLGTGPARVPAGSHLTLELRLESVHEGILASSNVQANATGECVRCLEPLDWPLDVRFQELFAYSQASEDDFLVTGEKIDLEQAVRDAVVLSLPFNPTCSKSCLGLCSECGMKLADDPNHVHESPVDSRWSELEKFRKE